MVTAAVPTSHVEVARQTHQGECSAARAGGRRRSLAVRSPLSATLQNEADPSLWPRFRASSTSVAVPGAGSSPDGVPKAPPTKAAERALTQLLPVRGAD